MGAAAISNYCPFTIYKRKYLNSIISKKSFDALSKADVLPHNIIGSNEKV